MRKRQEMENRREGRDRKWRIGDEEETGDGE